jgi:hypothetical protein
MDSLHFCIAIAPLSVYLLLLGLINLSGGPFVTTGGRDAAALGIGLAGMAIAGPMEMFMPHAAASRFGMWVWLMLLIFYSLCVSLAILLMRPRIVVYNVGSEQMRVVLGSLVTKLDREARWAGDSVALPTIGVHLHIEPFAAMRNVQLVSTGGEQSFEGWRLLEKELRAHFKSLRTTPNPYGYVLLIASAILAVFSATWIALDRQGASQALNDFLFR